MGLFKKKADPISERARMLNEQIAALEEEIQKLSSQPEQPARGAAPPAPPRAAPAEKNSNHRAPASQPRLRSTALPHGHSGSTMHGQGHTSPSSSREPVFEDVPPVRADAPAPAAPERRSEMGVRRDDLRSWWERIKNNFRNAPPSNPKLVNYLAAGSIQGLRPLRYEKRVARNRFLLFVIVLAVVLWGLVAVLLKR